ncbi:thiamine pyrophosphate-dependent enzyme [Actinospica sp.]|jgi:benzoylformate decarboxylase|uniref:thiamine pyrophosphate-dependent enzyme n=1 Tax=Actinospica sp. TaxID=1872142 RepID=UPI002C3281CE|nr:thiamine pyrophosphate-dependent enzyme [Actinospica sp.]HWG24664.1 thiamine pyrophosphate-dependent enzyme [Actinospica sp.]
MVSTVREAAFEVMRGCGFDRVFANPGSTEIAFLADLPEDFAFVLALHEGSVVGMATGYALATGRPALVNLHTTAGLGNAVGAIATARTNRAPLVVVVGQQDRRHLALEPFLAGRLDGLAGGYPVWTAQPTLAQDVPAALLRAYHEAVEHSGPAIVVVPMDDWSAPYDDERELAAPLALVRSPRQGESAVRDLTSLLDVAERPMIVAGSGADTPERWAALVALAERLGAPVWQEAFGARAGFPQDHALFAGHLPPGRSGLRSTLDGHDFVLVVGAPAFRLYGYEAGRLVPDGTTVAVLSDAADELHHSAADLAFLADPAFVCADLARRLRQRPAASDERRRPAAASPSDGSLTAVRVFTALAERLPRDAVVVEETPSSRPDLHRLLPARSSGGFVSAAMGGLGFALPAAAGLRMGNPNRPVVALLGDGSSLYAIQGLWSAARYECGALFIVLTNGRYAVMDQLAAEHGGKPPWPGFAEIDIAALAGSLGCPSRRITTHAELLAVLDEVIPTLAARNDPLLLDVRVSTD